MKNNMFPKTLMALFLTALIIGISGCSTPSKPADVQSNNRTETTDNTPETILTPTSTPALTPVLTDRQNSKFSNGLIKAVKEYIRDEDGYVGFGGQSFVSVHIFGTEEKDGYINVYLWALIEEHTRDGVSISAASKPLIIQFHKAGDHYIRFKYQRINSGEAYASEVRKHFPQMYHDEIFSFNTGPNNIQALIEENRQQALEYFKSEALSPAPAITSLPEVNNLLLQYGWHPEGGEYIQKVKIPSTFKDEPGELPYGLYWAYNNLLSKTIGLGFSQYKGRKVTAHIVPLKEEFGDTANRKIRAVIIEVDKKIAGAWLTGYGFLAALNKLPFDILAGKPWDEWLIEEGIVDYKTGYEAALKSLSPEDIIKKHNEYLNKKDFKSAFSLFTKASQTDYLFVNKDYQKLFNDSIHPYADGDSNIISHKLLKIEPYDMPFNTDTSEERDKIFNMKIYGMKEFMVITDTTYKEEMTRESGENTWFYVMVKESPDAPWKINAIGSGP